MDTYVVMLVNTILLCCSIPYTAWTEVEVMEVHTRESFMSSVTLNICYLRVETHVHKAFVVDQSRCA